MTRLLGTLPQQVPTNADLGTLTLQDSDSVNITGGQSFLSSDTAANYFNDTQISNVKPSLNLDFCNNTRLDPRITYTRSSTGSYYDGKTFAVAEQNLATYSQDFTKSDWLKYETVVIGNTTIAPDGTLTGSLIYNTGTSDPLVSYTRTVSAGQVAFSVYLKQGSERYVTLKDNYSGGDYGTFDLLNGVCTQNGGNFISPTITAAPNGWWRCSGIINYTATTVGFYIRFMDNQSSGGANPTIINTNLNFFLWGFQLEQRSAVSAYTPTTSAAITNYIPALQTAANNTPRFDYDPISGECKGFLIEEQRTNLIYQSQFASGWNVANATIKNNFLIAPDGTLTGAIVTPDTVNTAHDAYQDVTLSDSTTYTFSGYVKSAGLTWVGLFTTNKSNVSGVTYFDVMNGVVGTVDVTHSNATIIYVGNGWYRCSISFASATGATTPRIRFEPSIINSRLFASDGWKAIGVWGAQLEQGSFATSYIPTDSAQVTRSRDIAYLYGSNMNWFNNYEGSIVTEANAIGTSDSNYWTLSDGTINNTFVAKPLSNLYKGSIGVYNNIIFQFTLPSFTFNAYHKTSFAYGVNNYGFSFDGSSASTATGAVPSLNRFDIGFGAPGSSNPFDGWIKSIKYYPKRLSNAELQELTS